MIKDNQKSHEGRQAGVSLIITFFIMIIILSVVLSVSVLLYSQVKVIRNIGNSVVGFYAADSGVEKVLYYDRHVIPAGAERGLCSIFDSVNNPNYCASGTTGETSIYCNSFSISGLDCGVSTCTNCTISFNTTFDIASSNKTNYYVTAKIYPDGSKSDFTIDSKGDFGGAERQVETFAQN